MCGVCDTVCSVCGADYVDTNLYTVNNKHVNISL